MRLRWSDAYCVRYLRTFQVMPWPYKILDVSFIFVPIVVTWIASANHEWGLAAIIWLCLAIAYWLILLVFVMTFIRGHFARKRGVQPALPGAEPNLDLERRILWWTGIATSASLILGFVLSLFQPIHDKESFWTYNLLLPCFIVQQATTYARRRFWNAEL